ncbi:NADP-dependent isocitrate dehydrogenase [Litoribrevibacter albus]|uniref:Isocitrate dehydrogenase [NADP] n=1 Tax=Litoribrevibacter albus TaxID=1473156 RepID=A0AA37W649_9GAMM|nr:NADP-dependent isocitrate dehydrogenase [Litoribrevibacter albus]GLQ29534.1 isocitrate dehydrogenase, NADP-dependent [Litoribrevibacter albus]
MTNENSKIIYTKTDEAPALATYSLLPIIQAFTTAAGVKVETRDISLAGRIIAAFPENLTKDQKQTDDLAELGELAKTPEANIIKLPNISASIPQLIAAITELQEQGYDIPDYPKEAESESEKEVQARYKKILGSAVNPVLREGNSDRRVAAPVKQYAQTHPHSMGAWSSDSKSHVAHMDADDFYGSEQSVIMPAEDDVKIEFVAKDGSVKVLKESTPLQAGEVIDSSRMSAKALRAFYEKEIDAAKEEGVLLSLHLKATMMKVSDPVMFGHAVSVFYKDVFAKYADLFADLGVDPSNGIGDVYAKIKTLSSEKQKEIKADIKAVYKVRPELAMVDSDRGITNLHVPNDVIVDASMPACIRASGRMWGPDGGLQDTKAMIPDRCYSRIFEETIQFCKENGAFNVQTMGNVSNVGLMAQKAEEYGSHDKTFILEDAGQVRVVNKAGETLMSHDVEEGDIWRMCQTKDAPIQDWVKLAVNRAKATGQPAIFWLDENRAHDANLITLVTKYLQDHDTSGLEIKIMEPVEAIRFTLQRVKDGENTISVTGNVLRDYLTDLFPILELGTSAKMLSIVPLLAGGGLYETGAGGSAPKHAQQLAEEGHLRWDSLGEFLALTVSLEDLGHKTGNQKALVLAETLTNATCHFLERDKSPQREVGGLDNRGSHFYLCLYWAQELARQDKDAELKAVFEEMKEKLTDDREEIVQEFSKAQGKSVELYGYYHPDDYVAAKVMRPSPSFNKIINAMIEG